MTKQRIILIFWNIVVVYILLVMIEGICCYLVRNDINVHAFLINTKQLIHIPLQSPPNGFNLVDPLLGWGRTEERLKALGFKVEDGSIILTTSDDTAGRINILITGGSTSDLANFRENWPVEFCGILKQHGIKAKLYCSGVGGYNSAQEFLKLVREGIYKAPFVHISYSGANEIWNQSFTSEYLQNFYEDEVNGVASSLLMPNTVAYFTKLRSRGNLFLVRENKTMPRAEFWETNMRLMHGTANELHYRFIGFLQPVFGSGKYTRNYHGYEKNIAEYRQYFPGFRQAAARHPEFLVDLTDIFDTCKGDVFMDNCHLQIAYQPLVAQHIFDVLVERKILSP